MAVKLTVETVKIGNGPEQLLFVYCPHCGKAIDGAAIERAAPEAFPKQPRIGRFGQEIGPVPR